MMEALAKYFGRLGGSFGEGWTRFWFTPSLPDVLGAIRLSMGLLVVYLHATLLPDLVAFFGPNGLLPARAIEPLEDGSLSYLNYLSAPTELWVVHTAGLAVLAAFAAGLWTRLTSILALVVFLSDINRAPMITGRAESVAAMVLCYLWLSPCGARFSVDHWLSLRRQRTQAAVVPPTDERSTLATIVTRLIQIHLALLVAMMAFSQLAGEVWWSGTGMWWLIARQESRLVDFSGLHATPKLIDLWTHAIVLFELCFAVLIWVPLARPLLLAAGVLVWTSLALVTGDVPFAVAMCIASLSFVDPRLISDCCGGTTQPATATIS